MKIYSEKTKKEYKTVDECIEAEKAFDAEQKRKEEEHNVKKAQRATRAKEVEDAYSAYVEAYKKYRELLSNFVNDYGSFHYTYSDKDNTFSSFFDSFLNLF